ncbi:MAG: FKBP-type peptidyl-prolyl cis-trans isomerase [Flavobacteriales bacterium]|nr:FKBP-type peptidyl-prolyl cis-trans isomerase [Flavobacteriales bacterium]MDW8431729.1 FKBP-type peptidyl-prolyl cis-trans isomerase [Flavobacteriales bacterium]
MDHSIQKHGLNLFLAGLMLGMSWACRNGPQPTGYKTEGDTLRHYIQRDLEQENKRISETENQDIENYIRRRGWPFFNTGTGLRIAIYEKGQGRRPRSGDVVWLTYKVSLLNGRECYRSAPDEAESFTVDFDLVESGLHEAMKYLREGDRAFLIIPSHLAFGLLGDSEKIPSYSTVVYDVYLAEVEPRQP